jgi:hypothetical protein
VTDAGRALEIGRSVADPQAVYFVLAACAHVFALAGDRDRAVPLARELVAALRTGVGIQFAVIELPAFVSVAEDLGVAGELAFALDARPQTRWTAAAILGAIGARPEEAEARLRSARRRAAEGRPAEADEELRRAARFFGSVGASRYLRECEAVLQLT